MNGSPALALAAVAFAAALLAPGHASAVDYRVTRYDDPAPDGCQPTNCSLREAVIDADADPGADRILLSAGTYRLTRVASGLPSPPEDGDLNVSTSLEILGVGAGVTVIDPQGTTDPAIRVNASGGTFALRKVTIANGDSDGLALSAGDHTVEDCEIRDNGQVSDGDGIRASIGAAITIRRTTVAGNSGDGIRLVQATVALENVTSSGNGLRELVAAMSPSASCTHCTLYDPVDAEAAILVSETALDFANSVVAGDCSFSSGGVVSSSGGNAESPGDTCMLDTVWDQTNVPDFLLGLGLLADNGGATRTHYPSLGSALVGGARDLFCLTEDQRGAVRTTSCEVGAVERATSRPPKPLFLDGFDQGDSEAWTDAVP